MSKSIQVVTSEGARGPVYIQFSTEPVANTEPASFEDDLVIDFDATRGVIGIEALVKVARNHDLDLTALIARSFAAPAAA